MKLYLLYLTGQLALPTLLATLALTGAVWLSQSLRFVDLIVNKGVPLTTFLHLTLLLLPSLLLVVLPFALFCAALYVYHRLTQESELTVMRAAGLSNLQLAAPCLLLAGVVTVFGYATSLYFMPTAFRGFRDLQLQLQRDFSYLLLQPGVFNSPTRGVTIYVRSQADDGALMGILVHDERQADAPVTMMAEKGFLLRGSGGPRFVLERGNRQELDAHQGAAGVSLLHFDRYTLELAASAEADSRARKFKELYLSELLDPSDPDLSQANRKAMIAEGHKRLTWPLHALVFALIALAALLGRRTDRRGPAKGIVLAVVAAIAVQASSMAAGSVSTQVLAVIPILYLILLTVSVICLAMLLGYRLRRTRLAPVDVA